MKANFKLENNSGVLNIASQNGDVAGVDFALINGGTDIQISHPAFNGTSTFCQCTLLEIRDDETTPTAPAGTGIVVVHVVNAANQSKNNYLVFLNIQY